MDLRAELVLLVPRAVTWAESEAAAGAAIGRALSDAEIGIAKRVAVRSPERIRVVTVEALPSPSEPTLREAASQAGLLNPGMRGLTLGHTVFVRRGCESPQLLAHEFRHVFQYETAGSIAAFLPEYIHQVMAHGYSESPFERDARAHESSA